MEWTDHRIELTRWRGKAEHHEGDQLDYITFGVEELSLSIENLGNMGVEIAKEPHSLGLGSSQIIFIKDSNGIWIEPIEQN
jgi:hypothetical protein